MTERQAMMKAFLGEMCRYSPVEARVMACAFRGDPNDDVRGKWRSWPVTSFAQLDDGANVYLAVSAMKANSRGEFRRRKENFSGGLLLMIDDIGSGPGSKFPMTIIDAAQPTALIETSPGNHQAVYMFDSLVTDMNAFDALISGFIARQFLGKDTGMAGVNRVFRPPFGVNGKPKYGLWQVRAAAWHPESRYSLNALASAFKIDLDAQSFARVPHNATIGRAEGIRAFVAVRQALRDSGMLKRNTSDLSGWQDVICPWTGGHTGEVDNGAAIREPAEENGWVGAFRCHHGSCEGRGWRELTEWLAENQSEVLERINGAPGKFEDYWRKE
jgi:hypothetical protein